MNEQKNPIPQEQQYRLLHGDTPALPPVDPDPCMALEDIGLLREGYRTMRDMFVAVTEAQRSLAARTTYLATLLHRERVSANAKARASIEAANNLAARWERLYENELANGRKSEEQHKEELKKLRSENASLRAGNFKLARKPRRKGGRK